jgi:hypothetical protein
MDTRNVIPAGKIGLPGRRRSSNIHSQAPQIGSGPVVKRCWPMPTITWRPSLAPLAAPTATCRFADIGNRLTRPKVRAAGPCVWYPDALHRNTPLE